MEDSTKVTSFRGPTKGEQLVAKAMQQHGSSPKRVSIGGKHYYVMKISGEYSENFNLNEADLDRINKIGTVLLKIHKKYAEDNGLKDREIDYIDSAGVQYKHQSDTDAEGPLKVHHYLAKAHEESEAYLKATDDFKWQKDILDWSLQDIDNENMIPTKDLPRLLQKHLQPTIATRQSSFSVEDIKAGLLSFAREKIIKTYAVFAKVSNPDSYLQETVIWADNSQTAGALIEDSNAKLKKFLTAQHVWETMQTFFEPHKYTFVPAPIRDRSDDELISSSSKEKSSDDGDFSCSPSPHLHAQCKNPEKLSTDIVDILESSSSYSSSREEELSDDESHAPVSRMPSPRPTRQKTHGYHPETTYTFDEPISTKERGSHKRVPFLSLNQFRLQTQQPTRAWWDTSEATAKRDAYKTLHLLAMHAADYQEASLIDSKEICEQAAIKIKEFNQKALTSLELGAVKYIITIREANPEFSKLVYEERFDAVVEELEILAKRGIRP